MSFTAMKMGARSRVTVFQFTKPSAPVVSPFFGQDCATNPSISFHFWFRALKGHTASALCVPTNALHMFRRNEES